MGKKLVHEAELGAAAGIGSDSDSSDERVHGNGAAATKPRGPVISDEDLETVVAEIACEYL